MEKMQLFSVESRIFAISTSLSLCLAIKAPLLRFHDMYECILEKEKEGNQQSNLLKTLSLESGRTS